MTCPFSPPAAHVSPSGENATLNSLPIFHAYSRRSFHVAVNPSDFAEEVPSTRRFPPRSGRGSEGISHTPTVPSSRAVRSVCPSGLNATPFTDAFSFGPFSCFPPATVHTDTVKPRFGSRGF